MYCKRCGSLIDDNSKYCDDCGKRVDWNENKSNYDENNSNNGANILLAILGFLFPIIGFILYLVYEGRKPQIAKYAVKGAIIGHIVGTILSILIFMLYTSFLASILGVFKADYIDAPFTDILNEEISDEAKERTQSILANDADVTFGEFKMSNDDGYTETSLPVTVKNKSDKAYSIFLTIEAVDANGERIDLDTNYIEKVDPGQEETILLFEFIDIDKVPDFSTATFKVMELEKVDI